MSVEVFEWKRGCDAKSRLRIGLWDMSERQMVVEVEKGCRKGCRWNKDGKERVGWLVEGSEGRKQDIVMRVA